jgi:transcriptional regulator with XRE-family HTH domain
MNVLNTCAFAAAPTHWPPNVGGNPAAPSDPVAGARPPTSRPATGRPLHRLGEVRQREGLTRSHIARHLGISVQEVQQQEEPSSDMLLSNFYQWQKVLEVPAAELLNEPDGSLSPPVQLRARLLRIMKTARSIQDGTRQVSIRRFAQVLVDQLVELMPELADTAAWPARGRRRNRNELGQAFFRGLPLEFFEGPECLEH